MLGPNIYHVLLEHRAKEWLVPKVTGKWPLNVEFNILSKGLSIRDGDWGWHAEIGVNKR